MKKIWMTVLTALVVLGLNACSGIDLKAKHQNEENSLITNKIATSLFYERSLRTSQINARTTHGVVQLSGVVEKPSDVETATRIATGIPGVIKVDNTLVVKQ